MSKLTQAQRDLITQAWNADELNKSALMKLLIFDHAQGKALDKFKKNILAANGISIENETVILFRDFTSFGSGKDVVLITSEQLIQNASGSFSSAKISDIKLVEFLVEKEIMGELKYGKSLIKLRNGSSISILATQNIFDLIKAIVDTLLYRDTAIAFDETTDLQPCSSCGAVANQGQHFCEYCGTEIIKKQIESKSIKEAETQLVDVTGQQISQPASNIGVADELFKLKQLVDAGILTNEEFEHKKKQLLGM